MSDQSEKAPGPEFLAGQTSAEAIQKQFIEAPMSAAQQPAMNIGLELLAFMSSLPGAVIDSEQRELKRLSRTAADNNDPRIERLNVSIQRATELRAASQQGKARIDRALVSLSEEGHVFHGFVSDGNLHPQKGLTVRMTVARDGGNEPNALSATTGADGYFSIPLGRDAGGGRKSKKSERDVNMSERIAEWLSRVNVKTDTHTTAAAAAAASASNEVLARVEILDANKTVVHEDSSPLVVNAGTAYREYVTENNDGGKDRPRDAGNPQRRSSTIRKN